MRANQIPGTIWNRNFICVFLANLWLGMATGSTNTLISTFAGFIGAGAVLVGFLSGLFYGVSFAMRPVAGPVMTKLDKRKLMIFAFALGLLLNIGYAYTRDIHVFIVLRTLAGVQYSILGSLLMTIASDSLPPHRMGTGLSYYGISMAISMAAGPSIAIALKDTGTYWANEDFGFTLVFLFAAICMAFSLVSAYLLDLPKVSKEELAKAGSWHKNIIAPNAIVPAVILLMLVIAHATLTVYLYPYAQALGISGIGAFFTVFALVLFVTRPISGRLIDRFGTFKMILIGALIFAVSFILVGISRSLASLLCAAVIASLGFGTAQPAVQTMCIQAVIPIKRAAASNTAYFGLDLGLFLGPLVGGVIYSAAGLYSLMYIAMVVPIGLGMIVLVLTWKSYEVNRKQAESEL